MRAGFVKTLAVVVLAAGCSGGVSDESRDTVPETVVESSDPDPTSDSSPLFSPNGTDATTEGEDPGGESVVEPATERISFDGVTFQYDPEAFDGIAPSRVSSASATATDADSVPADVRFEFRVGDLATSVLTVVALADRDGDDYDGASAPRRNDALAAADGVAGDGEAVSFINGSGFRRVDDDGTYRFVGFTNDGRFLVDVYFDSRATADPLLLDDIVGSVFVDVGADALNGVGCVDDAFFVSDQTVPEGSEIEPGAEFVKVWRFRNTGTCVWDEQYSLAFGGGTVFTVLETGAIETTKPGAEIDLNVRLRAPEEPGAYGAQWQLIGPSGLDMIGAPAVLFINVPSADTD